MLSMQQKHDLILESEERFTHALADRIFDKPVVSYWMILIPILFLYFVYRMQKYKNGRRKFREEFMRSRRKALDLALAAVVHGTPPALDDWVRRAGVSPALEQPYRAWMAALMDHHGALLRADGDDFSELVRGAFGDHTRFKEALRRLTETEGRFYDAMRPELAKTPGAVDVVAAIRTHSRELRAALAQATFDGK
jgi:hypothetical protein